MNDKVKALLTIIAALFFLIGCSSLREMDEPSPDKIDLYDASSPELATLLEVDYEYEDVSSGNLPYEEISIETTEDAPQDALPVIISSPLVIASAIEASHYVQSSGSTAKIKIVSGDGMPLSSKQLSKTLQGKGYNIDRIDVAPYTFDKQVVFYSKGYEAMARQLADEINATGGIKLISWDSIYDIIIVSVEKQSP